MFKHIFLTVNFLLQGFVLLFSFCFFQSFAPLNACFFFLVCFAVEPPVVLLLLILLFDLLQPLIIHLFKLFPSFFHLVVIDLLHHIHFLHTYLVLEMEALTLYSELVLFFRLAVHHPCFNLLHLAFYESFFFFLFCQFLGHAAVAILLGTTGR